MLGTDLKAFILVDGPYFRHGVKAFGEGGPVDAH